MKTFKLLSIKLLSVLVLTSATYFPAKAECEFETLIGVDLVSNYIWRGIDCGGVSIQPTLGVAYKGFTLSAWGSMDLTSVKNEYIRNESELGSRYFPKELDFSLSYEYKGLSLAVTDYWFSSDAYFKYKKHNSSHLFEGTVGYDFGFLSLSWNTIFAGADYKENGDRAYSSYFDVNSLKETISLFNFVYKSLCSSRT